MKYRKKPIVIEAVQFKNTAECIADLMKLGLDPKIDYHDPDHPIIRIDTLEGEMIGDIGDYIIKGISGEFYPCKPDIFQATYEKVD